MLIASVVAPLLVPIVRISKSQNDADTETLHISIQGTKVSMYFVHTCYMGRH